MEEAIAARVWKGFYCKATLNPISLSTFSKSTKDETFVLTELSESNRFFSIEVYFVVVNAKRHINSVSYILFESY